MSNNLTLRLIIGLISGTVLFALLLLIVLCITRRGRRRRNFDAERPEQIDGDEAEIEDLVTFPGGEELTIAEILDAPGEVIGKSSYGTLYKAFLQTSNRVNLLRFLRPICAARAEEFGEIVQLLGFIRHRNLVPLLGVYGGSRGEKLLVYPFFGGGNLAQFIREGSAESHNWTIIYKISTSIAEGLDHLHSRSPKPIPHGNLKSKNILLDRNYQPYISDFGLHLLLNPTAAQQMLETSAAEGYKAPELIKMKEANEQTDIYSLGVVFLELLTGKEPVNENPTPGEDFELPTFMRNAVLDRRISDLYHPKMLISSNDNHEFVASEECILKFFQLAMACCSPSPSLRPTIKQVLWKLEEIGRR